MFLAENRKVYDAVGNKRTGVAYKGFDSDSYCDMLEKLALPSIIDQYGSDFYFAQDNASIHVAKTKDKAHRKVDLVFKKFGVKEVKLPALSPDLNCIENCHPLIQDKLDEILTLSKRHPKNKKELFSLLRKCWDKVDNNKVKKIYFSFLDRCLKVQNVGGKNNLKL